MELFSEEPVKEIPELQMLKYPNPLRSSLRREIKRENLSVTKRIEKIIFVYNDNTFRELKPE